MEGKKKNIFTSVAELLKENASRVVLLVFFLLVFSWPYISSIYEGGPAQFFGYLFVTWLVLVFVLWIANSVREDNDQEKQ